MTPELIGILAVGATLIGIGATMIGLLLTFRRDTRADMATFRAEMRADMQAFRKEVQANFAQVRGELADLRKDLHALTERVSRLEGVIDGLFAPRSDRDRHDAAA
ncbi:MAG: hypothetical protein OXG65_03895 [Chloroflexi bacterium]|nr:hypothetical protein [Chloroflexota bacterium]